MALGEAKKVSRANADAGINKTLQQPTIINLVNLVLI